MLKGKKIVTIICAVALLATFTVPAFASSHQWAYSFYGSGQSWGQPESDDWRSKEDNEQYAYVSLYKYSQAWTQGVDRVYLWVENQSDTELTTSSYYTTQIMNSQRLHYTTYTEAGTSLGLAAWHDNHGRDKTFSVGGLWTP